MKEDIKLNLFNGASPSDKFLRDISHLNHLTREEAVEIIDWIIEEYPKGDLDESWNEKSKRIDDEKEKKLRGNLVNALLVVLTKFASKRVTESELREDAKNIRISEEHLDYSIAQLKLDSAKSFRKKAFSQNQPFTNRFSSISWRIDKQNAGSEFEETICVMEMIYRSKGERNILHLDLNAFAVNILINILKKIERDLDGLTK